MSLIFDKNGKKDKRLAEYEQEAVRAGLEKVAIEKEVERAKQDLAEVERKREDVTRIGGKEKRS